ncbi:hypothetical protein K7X08_037495 [Anisodus acutangulus]|uniref:Uncharacterized protein n=1 Tax=Anisodus acutangulus TaxID=402998 RepID=A0A9Q1RSP0_9SOLA|nr:hypothetical protein K7X08_037495 [Anisodus acutangulus]
MSVYICALLIKKDLLLISLQSLVLIVGKLPGGLAYASSKDALNNITKDNHNIALRTIPLRTHGTSNPALTSVVRYLIHDSSEYASGNIFIVDAGATLPGSRSRRHGSFVCLIVGIAPIGYVTDVKTRFTVDSSGSGDCSYVQVPLEM